VTNGFYSFAFVEFFLIVLAVLAICRGRQLQLAGEHPFLAIMETRGICWWRRRA
jgi:hypothetical protein